MKFFDAKQVQEVISTEYPDREWDINLDGYKYMRQDILKAIDNSKSNFEVSFQVAYSFTRDLPKEAPISSGKIERKFNFSSF